MIDIHLKVDDGVPQFVCNTCYNCKSLFGKSLCDIKNRGCCWYFPKFTLYEIHKMVKSEEGLAILSNILKLPKTIIYNYYIHSKGYFDENGYKTYIKNKNRKTKNHDESMFFRACPFVKTGVGCTIPAKYRSYICNLFVCDEVTQTLENDNDQYKKYVQERDNYVRWIDWENNSIQMMLYEKNLNLIDNFDEVINILKEMPLEEYEFKDLKAISVKPDEVSEDNLLTLV